MRLRRVAGIILLLSLAYGGSMLLQEKLGLGKGLFVFSDNIEYEDTMKRDILCLMMAYPDFISGLERNKDGKVYLLMKSGKKIIYDDKKIKTRGTKSAYPDLQDMMEEIYPLNNIKGLQPASYNPGCIREYNLLKEVYGNTKEKIKQNLVKVSIGYRFVEFNCQNNAAKALENVMKELLPLTRQSNKIYGNSFPISGTYNYRIIAGTNRLSSHAYGIGIDLNNRKTDYWRWTTREDGQKRLDTYPQEIVGLFEKYGFIWGGKWGNFDFMHYEYRPEIILKARYFSQKPVPGIPWYYGLQDNSQAWQYIWLIEEKI